MMTGQIVGVVLAGGEGLRMGGHKPDVILAGSTLRDRALGVLDSVFETVVLSVARPTDDEIARQLVVDRRTGLGPLAALESVLTFAAGHSVFLLACDMPFVTAPVVERIVESAAEDSVVADVSVGACNGRSQPLCGLYSGACIEVVQRRLDSRRLSMHGLLAVLEVNEVNLDDLGTEVLLNINRREDLARAGRLIDG